MQTQPPLVSVMIICYNQQRYIREAVTSALDQGYRNLEVVVADDASTDDTPKILRELQMRYPERLKLVLNATNHGITGNSNVGLKHCSGELVAFMGGDDVLLPGKIERQVEWFGTDPHRVLCGHDVEWIDADSAPLGIRSSDLVPMQAGKGVSGFIRDGSPYAATAIMVRRSRIPPWGFHRALPVVSDWKLWLDVIGTDGAYGRVDGVYARYRRHRDNVTARANWRVTRDVLMTALLSLMRFRGRYLAAWAHYFLIRPLRKRLFRRD